MGMSVYGLILFGIKSPLPANPVVNVWGDHQTFKDYWQPIEEGDYQAIAKRGFEYLNTGDDEFLLYRPETLQVQWAYAEKLENFSTDKDMSEVIAKFKQFCEQYDIEYVEPCGYHASYQET